ncbi:MAG: secretin N-terminal domain-containing protein [Planctomycetota bacterium]
MMKSRIQVSKTYFYRILFILSFLMIIPNNWIQAEENSTDSFPRYRVFSLKHIPAEHGKNVLEQLEIGTVSQLPNSNTLLVTAEGNNLIKANSILELIDSEKKYVIEIISSASEVNDVPTNEQLESQLGSDVSIGTFDSPPSNLAQERVLIDTHNGMFLVFTPEEISENIFNAIEKLSRSEETSELIPEPNLSTTPAETGNADEEDEFFKKLLDSLDEAEQKAVDLQLTTQPSEEIKSRIIEFQGKKPDITELDVSTVIEKEAAVEKMDIETEGTEGLLATLSESSPLNESTKEINLENLKDKADKIQSKSGVIALREKKPAGEQEIIKIDEGLYRPEFPVGTKEELKINLPSKLNITDLLSLVGEYLELDFMYDPKKVKGEVMLKFRGPIRVRDLYPLMESVLKFHGFVMTRKESLVTIVPIAEALTYDPKIYSEPGSVKVGDVIITRIFKLQHIDSTSARNLLQRMKLGASIEEIPATKTVIVTEYAYRMPRIEELIKMIDQPGKPKKFRYRRLEFTLATSLVTQVKNLADKLGSVSVTVSAPARSATPKKQPASRTQRATTPKPTAKKPSTAATPAKTVDTSVYLVADERTNRILMIGLDEDLNVIEDIIGALDVEKEDLRALRLYEIQYVGAEDVANKLRDLGIISVVPGTTTRGRTSSRGRITSTARPTAQRPAGAAAAQQQPQTTDAASVEEILTGEPQVVIIESTNSLLINGTSEQHTQIALIIGYVDSETERASIPYVVYPLENQDPVKLAGILNQLITETIETQQDPQGKIIQTNIQSRLEDEIVIISDTETYSLIVYASKKNQQWISDIIRQLDEYRPQVLLDVTLVQIKKTEDFAFDLEILGADPDMEFTSGMIPGVDSTIYDKLIAADRSRFKEFKIETGDLTGFYGSKQIQALLTSMERKDYGRILNRPKLLVNDNQKGSIKTATTTYVEKVEQSIISGNSTTQTESISYPAYSAGINLSITPHISKGNMLTLDIVLNRSGFIGEITGDIPPDRADADLTSRVTVPDGHTIILGGVEIVDNSKGGKKVPILGDLPLIGGLFREVKRAGSQDKLYIFVKAHILRPGADIALADLKEASNENRRAFEKLETEMEKYEIWPGIKPKPMDPVSVLEEY